MSSTIVSEVVKHLEVLPLNLQAQVLQFVRGLDSEHGNGNDAYEDDGISSVADVVARIKAMPPNPAMVTHPQGSLADALREGPTNPDFDLQRWQQEWAAAEAELKRINFEDDVAEGRI